MTTCHHVRFALPSIHAFTLFKSLGSKRSKTGHLNDYLESRIYCPVVSIVLTCIKFFEPSNITTLSHASIQDPFLPALSNNRFLLFTTTTNTYQKNNPTLARPSLLLYSPPAEPRDRIKHDTSQPPLDTPPTRSQKPPPPPHPISPLTRLQIAPHLLHSTRPQDDPIPLPQRPMMHQPPQRRLPHTHTMPDTNLRQRFQQPQRPLITVNIAKNRHLRHATTRRGFGSQLRQRAGEEPSAQRRESIEAHA